jgi:7-keto-8-aminopelargonate synthetase-like enzyme
MPWLDEELAELDDRCLLRSPRTLAGPTGPEAEVDGRRVLLFCSNDYLGLSGHPDVVEAARGAMGSAGFGACSSRLVCGLYGLIRRL